MAQSGHEISVPSGSPEGLLVPATELDGATYREYLGKFNADRGALGKCAVMSMVMHTIDESAAHTGATRTLEGSAAQMGRTLVVPGLEIGTLNLDGEEGPVRGVFLLGREGQIPPKYRYDPAALTGVHWQAVIDANYYLRAQGVPLQFGWLKQVVSDPAAASEGA